MDAPLRDVTVFTQNRARVLRGEVAGKFFAAVPADPQVKPPLPSDHFAVDGTLIEACASMKGFRAEGRFGRATQPWPQGPARLPRREALQRDARLED